MSCPPGLFVELSCESAPYFGYDIFSSYLPDVPNLTPSKLAPPKDPLMCDEILGKDELRPIHPHVARLLSDVLSTLRF